MKKRKVGIIGLGNVGSHCALSLVTRGIADDLVLVDIDRQKAVSERHDLIDCVSYLPHNVTVSVGDYADTADCDIVVLSLASKERFFTEDRLTEYDFNLPEIETAVPKIVKAGFKGIFISITNPCDVIAKRVWELSGFPAERVIGTGTALDSGRLKRILSELTGINPKSIQGYTMGEHGNSQMIPWSHVNLSGIPYEELKQSGSEIIKNIDEDKVLDDVRNAAWIVWYGKHCTDFAIGQVLSEIVSAIYRDDHSIFPLSTLLTGQYGEKNVYASTPCQIGKNGIERIFEIKLTEKELDAFHNSCRAMYKYH